MKNNKGLTLIETLVSIVLFGIISTLLVNIFVVSIRTQGRVVANQELVEQSTYALDYMATKIRMAIKDETGACNGSPSNYSTGENSIKFISYDSINSAYVCREFLLDNSIIKERISTDETSILLGSAIPITSNSFNVSKLKFTATGDDGVNQPRATIAITMSRLTSAKLTVQTTVSKRQLDL
jgi:prepilin-type N-terminal cleavage/methylation domain-containing protein